jgi:hypothetical protein
VLGTHGIGIIAEGYTKSSIERKPGDETTWKEGHRDMSALAPRIDITIRRNMASLSDLREANLGYLIGRQNTFSWLTESETFALENLLD